MRTQLRRISAFAFAVGFFLSGCASLSEKGEAALNKGDYDKALSLYQQAVRVDSDKPEAHEGLRRAQQAWLNRRLIDVRLLRLGNNLGNSETLLLELIANESEWQVFPTGAAFATQKEEIALFADRVQKRIETQLEKNNPLAAEYELRRNEFILSNALAQNILHLKNRIYTAATSYCQKTAKSLTTNEYYTGNWLAKTCGIWKATVKLPPLKNSVAFFNDTKSTSRVEGLNPDLTGQLEKILKQAFVKSKWYDEKGPRPIILDVSGKFVSKQSETPVRRVQNYSVQVPYTETSSRIKDPKRNNGIGGFLSVMALLSSEPADRVTDNGDGTETVVKTKYRSDPRTRTYSAVEMTASKQLQGKLTAKLDNQSFHVSFDENFRFNEDRHSENFPDIGLRPSNPILVSDQAWIEAIGEHLVDKFVTELRHEWLNRFCEIARPQESSVLSERESIFRCAYQLEAGAPEMVEQYYYKNFGISFKDWQEMVRSQL